LICRVAKLDLRDAGTWVCEIGSSTSETFQVQTKEFVIDIESKTVEMFQTVRHVETVRHVKNVRHVRSVGHVIDIKIKLSEMF
jgi:hypothetical protein